MKTKTAEQLAEERKYQKPKQELNHVWNIDYILKCLFVMDERKDWFYFEAYGREFIQNLVDQQVTAATEEMRKRIQELEAQVPKWISVEERLPDDENMNVIFMKLDGKWNKSEIGSWHKFKYFREYELKHEYTHWMPLPQPIK